MAFTAQSTWQVQTDGSDANNGGGFDTGVSGFPTDGAATSATSTAPVFTSASYNFVAGDVGARVYIKSGTNWIAGWYTIVSVAANAATLDAVIGNADVGVFPQGICAASTVAGCATVASPTGATWGVDYSQQAAAQITFTDMVIGGTTTQFTSVANPVGKNFIGNIINVTSGSGFTVQRVAIVSTSTITATCDKSLGTTLSTGGNGGLGGAFSSPGLASSVAAGTHVIYLKAGTYSISSATLNVTGGAVNAGNWIGYSTHRNAENLETKPIIQYTVTTVTGFAVPYAHNITIDGNGQASAKLTGANGHFDNCIVKNMNVSSGNTTYTSCYFTGWSVAIAGAVGSFFGCVAEANTATPFNQGSNNGLCCINCIALNNTGATTDGFTASVMTILVNCVAYGNGRDGFRASNTTAPQCINCHAEANTGVGFNNSTTTNIRWFLRNCSAYNNTGGATGGATLATTFLTITDGSVFTDAAGKDFSLNNTALRGALLRAAGIPGVMPSISTTGYRDIGVAQHADPVGGGGIAILAGEGIGLVVS